MSPMPIHQAPVEAAAENARRSVATCTRCGEIPGEGEKCVECAKVRIARNQPRPDTFAGCRLPAARLATSREPRAANKPPALPGDNGTSAKEKEHMDKRHECASGCGEPVAKEGAYCPDCAAITGGGRGRAASREPRAASQAKAGGGKHPCRNPSGNPHCAGTCGKAGGLCRSCGIREGKKAVYGVTPGLPATIPAAPPELGKLPAPANAAAEGPGPLTMAVCDFFAACARASDRVEATLLMERRAVTVTVKFQLPGAETAASGEPRA